MMASSMSTIRLTVSVIAAEQQAERQGDRIVAGDHRTDDGAADPRPGEHVLDEHRAGDQSGEEQPADRQRRREHVRQGVADVHDAGRKALAAGRADVVLAEHAQPLEADDAGEHGDRPEGQRQHGQDVRRRPRLDSATGRICNVTPNRATSAGGEDEVGDRLHEAGDAREADLGLAVSPVLREDRHPQPERVGDDDREDEGRPDESQGVRQPVADDLADGLAGDDRRAEVTRDGVSEVLDVLLGPTAGRARGRGAVPRPTRAGR